MNRRGTTRLTLLATAVLAVASVTLTGCSGALDDADYLAAPAVAENSSAA